MNNIQKILLIFLSISVGKTMVAMRGDQNERFKEGISNQIASISVGVVTKETFLNSSNENLRGFRIHLSCCIATR